MKNQLDTNLVSAAQAGDKAAFVDLVARYQGMVTGITLSILKDFQASEDAAQETFVTAWKKISDIQDSEKLRPWLAQIARNAALMTLRKKRVHPPLETFPGASEIPRPDELVAEKEEAQIVMSALEGLPEKLRLPLILFYRDDQSVRNVSDTLSLTPDIVKKRLAEGRALLRRRVTRLLDPVLRATGPGVLFTTAVAGTIGALMPPSVIAATAVSATPQTATLTAVTTSKLSLAATVITLSLCLPGGYLLHQTLKSTSPAKNLHPSGLAPTPSSRKSRTTSSTTPLVAQWNALKARHLADGPAGFPALFQEITTIEDPLQREAFIHLAIANWAKADPDAALAYFTESELFSKQTEYYQHRVISEWLHHDAPSALTAVEQQNLWSRGCSRNVIEFLSKGDPVQLTRAINLLPTSATYFNNSGFGNERLDAAITEAARRDFTATTSAIDLHLSPFRRHFALYAITRYLAETDSSKARAWISQLSPDDQSANLTSAYLSGLAKNDPASVFRELSELKPTLSWHQEADILTELSQQNFAEALAWAGQNPPPDLPENTNDFIFGQSANDELKQQLFSRIQQHGTSFLDELKNQQALDHFTTSESTFPVFDQPEILFETWNWLTAQDSSPGVNVLRNDLLDFAMIDNPQQAFQLLAELKASPSYQQLSSNLADFLISNTGVIQQGAFQSTLANAPLIVLEKIATSPALDLTNFENLTFWEDQLPHLSAQAQPRLAGRIATIMTRHNPAEASQWIATLPDPEVQQAAIRSNFQEWAQSYPDDANRALNSLQGQENFDSAAAGYLSGLARFDPETAYSQLQEFDPSWPYFQTTADQIILPLAQHEPALAQEWLAELPLSDQHKQNLTRQIEEQEKQSSDPFAQ